MIRSFVALRRAQGGLRLSQPCLAAAVLFGAALLSAQSQTARTVWDGVYSADQAERGRAAYDRSCASCHGPDLAGRSARTLVGDLFMRSWAEDSAFSLFDMIRTSMPPNLGRGLGDATYSDIVAYIFQRNAFPSGPTRLASDADVLRLVRIERREGPAPVPGFALVKVRGCLQGPVDKEWVLSRATEPVRTRLPYTAETAGPASAGRLTYRLFGIYPSPEAHVGQEVEVKGLLIRNASGSRINVTLLQTVSSSCGSQDAASKTVWDGIYTDAQSRRGEQLFKTECSYCHRDDLTGGFFDNGNGRAPALAGPGAFGSSFAERWNGVTVGEMVAAIASTMPQPKPASLTVQAYVDLVSYLFSKNDIPAGSSELPAEVDALGELLITPKH